MNLSLVLRRTLQKMVEQKQGISPILQDSRRRAEDLLEEMEQEQERLRKQRAKEQAAKRKREMEALAKEEPQLWPQVYELIARKQVKAYDEAVEILKRLNDLAAFQGKKREFQDKINRIHADNPRLSGLRSRLDHAGLSSER